MKRNEVLESHFSFLRINSIVNGEEKKTTSRNAREPRQAERNERPCLLYTHTHIHPQTILIIYFFLVEEEEEKAPRIPEKEDYLS